MVESHLDIGGAVTFWSLADWSDRARLHAEFAALGLDAFTPEPRPAPACLKDALEDVLGGPRVLVRPLAARDGFAVVREDRGISANSYANVLTAWVRNGSPPSFDPVSADAKECAQCGWDLSLNALPSTDPGDRSAVTHKATCKPESEEPRQSRRKKSSAASSMTR